MDYASGVGGIQSFSDLDAKRERGFHVQRLSRDPRLQGHAVQELHDDEGLTVLFPDLVYGADVRMVQGGSCLRLPLEARQCLRVFGDFIRQEFQGDKAMQRYVFSLIDDPHAATAELLQYAVMRYGLADKLGGSRHWRNGRSKDRCWSTRALA